MSLDTEDAFIRKINIDFFIVQTSITKFVRFSEILVMNQMNDTIY